MSEYSYVEPYAYTDEWLPSRRRTLGVVWTDDRPIMPGFPDTEVPVPAEPTICVEEPDLWFPEKKHAAKSIAQAKSYCRHCWMQTECRAYGLKHPTLSGVWGGLTQAERKRGA